MDVSQEYIKMCEKAEEIQNNWEPSYGDIYRICCESDNFGRGYDILEGSPKEIEDSKQNKLRNEMPESTFTFIPRQDQLQTLSKLSWQEFDYECINKYPLATTKEQAGIQVVMYQFNKEWEDNKWLDKTTQ